jgi:hypothetical protein
MAVGVNRLKRFLLVAMIAGLIPVAAACSSQSESSPPPAATAAEQEQQPQAQPTAQAQQTSESDQPQSVAGALETIVLFPFRVVADVFGLIF